MKQHREQILPPLYSSIYPTLLQWKMQKNMHQSKRFPTSISSSSLAWGFEQIHESTFRAQFFYMLHMYFIKLKKETQMNKWSKNWISKAGHSLLHLLILVLNHKVSFAPSLHPASSQHTHSLRFCHLFRNIKSKCVK